VLATNWSENGNQRSSCSNIEKPASASGPAEETVEPTLYAAKTCEQAPNDEVGTLNFVRSLISNLSYLLMSGQC
jgi:hypothetical protein